MGYTEDDKKALCERLKFHFKAVDKITPALRTAEHLKEKINFARAIVVIGSGEASLQAARMIGLKGMPVVLVENEKHPQRHPFLKEAFLRKPLPIIELKQLHVTDSGKPNRAQRRAKKRKR